MKQSRLFGRLIAVVLFVMASVSAMAQEYVLKNITFLKPGEKGVIAVGLKNPDPVKIFQGKVILPEGLTFVDGEKEGRAQISKTDRTSKFSLAMQKNSTDEHIAAFLGFNMVDAYIQPGEGEILTFEVNVASDFKGTGEIQLKEAQISMGGGNVAEPEAITGKVADVADQVITAAPEVKVSLGVPATVTVSCDFQKEYLSFFAATIELPEGLSIVDDSWKSDPERCPNHSASIVGKLLTVIVDDIFDRLTFTKKDGNLVSFEVVADDNFVDGSEIVLKNIYGVAKINGVNGPYYSEDLHIKVTKDTATGINNIESDFAAKADGIYTVSGLKVNKLVKGINIVVKDGKATKVVKK